MARSFGRGIAIVLLSLTILCFVVSIRVWWRAYSCRKSAVVFLGSLRKLKLGETTTEEVRILAREQAPFVTPDSPFYQGDFCTYSFLYSNYDSAPDSRAVVRLRLWRFRVVPPPTSFIATLDLRHNQLVRNRMSLQSAVLGTVEDEMPDISPVTMSYLVDNSVPSQIAIYLKPNSSAAQRESAYDFNLKCLDRLGGCTAKSQLFRSGGLVF
jgi:hypothetical protein